MLILSRKVADCIFIETSDGTVTVTVTEISRGGVKLGVEAPPTARISRGQSLRRPVDGGEEVTP